MLIQAYVFLSRFIMFNPIYNNDIWSSFTAAAESMEIVRSRAGCDTASVFWAARWRRQAVLFLPQENAELLR